MLLFIPGAESPIEVNSSGDINYGILGALALCLAVVVYVVNQVVRLFKAAAPLIVIVAGVVLLVIVASGATLAVE